MKKRIKYGLIAMTIHLFITTIPDIVFTKIGPKYEALGTLFAMFEVPYEAPLTFIQHIFNIHPKNYNLPYLIFIYIGGTLFYFCLGFLIGYLREPELKKK